MLLQFPQTDPGFSQHIQQIGRYIPQVVVILGHADGDGLFLVIRIGAELGSGRDARLPPQVVRQLQHSILQIVEGTAILAVVASAADHGQMDGEFCCQLVQGVYCLDQLHGGHLLFQNDHRAVQSVDLGLVIGLKAADLEYPTGEMCIRDRDSSGMFWLTGSQKFQMMQGVSESLAGRVAIFDMASLSTAEIEARPAALFHPNLDSIRERLKYSRHKNIHEIYEDIFRGGMPKLRSTDMDRDRFYMDYINTYIERDIKDLAQVGKLGEFYDFLVFMAARTGQELKYDESASAIGVSAPTGKSWVAILERSGVIFIRRPYYANITKRLVKTPKVYFMDTGLAAYLCRWPSAETLENGAMDGAFFETYVVTEIVKSYFNAGKPVDLFYYRDIDKKEIDLLFVEGDKMYPIEIKKGKEPSKPDKNFGVLQQFKMKVEPGIILCMSDELRCV